MKHPIIIIYTFIEIIYTCDWFALLITLGVGATAIYIGLLVTSFIGVTPP